MTSNKILNKTFLIALTFGSFFGLLLPTIYANTNGVNISKPKGILNEEYDATLQDYSVKLKTVETKGKYLPMMTSSALNTLNMGSNELDKWIQVKVSSPEQFNALKNDSNVSIIQKSQLLHASTIATTNDPFTIGNNDTQSIHCTWNAGTSKYNCAFQPSTYNDQWDIEKIKAKGTGTTPGAWDTTTGIASTVIAVIDTGIDLAHEDLNGNLWTDPNAATDTKYPNDIHGWNFVANNNNPSDDHGHGSHVAGTIAATANNSLGMAGICYGCKLMAVKVLDNKGSGQDPAIAAGIRYAVDKGAKILNLSLGGKGYSQLISDAVAYAWSNNVLSIFAAGNSANDSALYSPGSADGAIVVSATDYNDSLASFSNVGDRVDIAAPGVTINTLNNIDGTAHLPADYMGLLSVESSSLGLELLTDQTNGCVNGVKYFCIQGTSQATPHVAGVAGLVLSQHPTWTAKQLRYALLKNADLVPGQTGVQNGIGYGRLNALTAVAQTTPSVTGTPSAAFTSSTTIYSKGGNLQLTGTATAGDFYQYKITITSANTHQVFNSSQKLIGNGNLVIPTFGKTSVSSSNFPVINLDSVYPAGGAGTSPDFAQNQKIYPDDTYTITLKSEDFMGNIVAAPQTLTLNLNRGATTMTPFSMTSPANNQIVYVQPQFAWTLTTPSAGTVTYSVNVDGTNIATALTSTSYTPTTSLSVGSHTVKITATDSYGNTLDSSNVITFNTQSTLPGDLNQDRKIDISDLSIFAQHWKDGSLTDDLNGNSVVDLSDLSIFATNYGITY